MIATLFHLTPNDLLKERAHDAYGIHRLVYALFPQEANAAPREERDILYADRGMRKGLREVLVFSHMPPQQPTYGTINPKPIPEALTSFAAYQFEIVINPVRRENASRKIVPIRGREAIKEWFMGKSPQWGFAVAQNTMEVHSENVIQCKAKGQQLTLGQAVVTGFLRVTDASKFKQSFYQGIGRGKAFGCGLLQIIPQNTEQ